MIHNIIIMHSNVTIPNSKTCSYLHNKNVQMLLSQGSNSSMLLFTCFQKFREKNKEAQRWGMLEHDDCNFFWRCFLDIPRSSLRKPFTIKFIIGKYNSKQSFILGDKCFRVHKLQKFHNNIFFGQKCILLFK